MSTHTLTEVHRNVAEVVNEARYTDEPVIITDHGKTAAALLSPSLLEHYQQLQDEHDLAEIERVRTAGAKWVELDEAERRMDAIDAEADQAAGQ